MTGKAKQDYNIKISQLELINCNSNFLSSNLGPESLGVAFKTFEQLSGLWISVMHRIWRVWKAKGR